MHKVDNAVIMAAGTSSRFVPISYERPKALIEVNGEILIERQIRQLLEVGISTIYVVTGHKAEQFCYLQNKYGVQLIHNEEYLHKNNHSSIYAARKIIKNTYICSADNYFRHNPFEASVSDSYYAALYAEGYTNEWCMQVNHDGYINDVQVGGQNAWYMLGHAFWSASFSERFIQILEGCYDRTETAGKFWENIFMEHLDDLKMKIRKYSNDDIYEFDSLDELRLFDNSYIDNSRSSILEKIACQLHTTESKISNFVGCKGNSNRAEGFRFLFDGKEYRYTYSTSKLEEVTYE